MRKKVLFLGGAYPQIPSIQYAIDKGYYVITCDYLPNNPGHKLADEYHNVSTTDKEAVLNLASQLKIDGIVAYASDPAAPTASYVAEKLGLPGNPYSSIKILTEKDLYRNFLHENGFNAPKAKGFSKYDKLIKELESFNFPIMMKPVDSSGSKGASVQHNKDNLEEAFNYALSYSRAKRIIVEEYVHRKGPQMHGDCFVLNGKLKFACIGDHLFDEQVNPFVPVSTTFPTMFPDYIVEKAMDELNRAFKLLNLKACACNIEIMVDQSDNIYLMEIGPRNGGNFVPQVIKYVSGTNLVELTVDASLGLNHKGYIPLLNNEIPCAYYVIHSRSHGIFENISIDPEIEKLILEKHIYVKKGDKVKPYHGSNCSMGVIIFKADNPKQLRNLVENMEQYIHLQLIKDESNKN